MTLRYDLTILLTCVCMYTYVADNHLWLMLTTT